MNQSMNKDLPATPVRSLRGHSLEFRRDAVAAWRSSGLSVPQYAQQIGVHNTTLYLWVRSEDGPLTGVAGGRAPVAAPRSVELLEAELRAMRAELERTRVQRDILKKTLGIVCEPSPSVTSGSPR